MGKQHVFLLLAFCGSIVCYTAYAQSNGGKNSDSKVEKSKTYAVLEEGNALEVFDRTPSFGMFHDNYIITGIPTNKPTTSETADIKFQISIRQRITKSILPFKTFAFVGYTQKSFWDFYANSGPFLDNNYNPSINLGKALVRKNELKGLFVMGLEHESNGRDSIQSRGWNFVSLSGIYFFNMRFSAQVKFWIARVDRFGNPDLLTYRGHGFVALNYRSINERFRASLLINPRKKVGSFNTVAELSYRISSKHNQYIFLQHYNGYAENLLYYNQYRSMLRIGVCIKPPISYF